MGIKVYCSKCKSPNVYFQEGQYACMMCGERFYPPGVKPIIYKKIMEEEIMATRACRNCGRVRKIIGDDLESGCYYAVRKLTKGTPEYNETLAAAKKKFGDPNYKHGGSKQKGVSIKTKPAKTKTKAIVEDISIADQLIAERNRLQDRVFKLNQAIDLLS